jgi:hypothetical protein
MSALERLPSLDALADLDRLDALDRARHELLVDGGVDERARGARADLAAVEGEEDEALDRLVQLVVVRRHCEGAGREQRAGKGGEGRVERVSGTPGLTTAPARDSIPPATYIVARDSTARALASPPPRKSLSSPPPHNHTKSPPARPPAHTPQAH